MSGQAILAELEAVLRSRLTDPPPGSYSATLLADREQAQRKIMEEAFELCLELGRHGQAGFDRSRVAAEAADVVFHVLVGLVGAGLGLAEVYDELAARRPAGPATADGPRPAAPEGGS